MARPNLSHLNMLVIDDSAPMRKVITMILRRLDCQEIAEAASIKDAACALAERRFDAILLDYKLDTRTGVDILRLLRGSDKTPNRRTPVLMLTGQTRQEIVDEATAAGVDAFILKPVMPEALGWRVLETVSQVREREIAQARHHA